MCAKKPPQEESSNSLQPESGPQPEFGAQPEFSSSSIASGERLSNLIHHLCHEADNPLTAVISIAAVLKRLELEESDPTELKERLYSYCGAITDEAWRVSGLLERLVYIVSTRSENRTECELKTLLHSTLARMRDKEDFEAIDVSIHTPESCPSVSAAPSQLEALMKELLLNAHHAAQNSAQNAPYVRISLETHKGSLILKTLNSTAAPCSQSLASYFEPFVTETKDTKHPGLGLTMAWAIVERWGGQISLSETQSESGSEFCVLVSLPCSGAEAAADKVQEAAFSPTAEKPKERSALNLLVIEDEPMVASAIEKILQITLAKNANFSCQVAMGADSLELLKKGERFDAILCDLNLKDINGRHVLEQIKQIAPSQEKKLAFLTGDKWSPEVQSYLESCGRPYLLKPFEPEALLKLVNSLRNS